MFQFCIHFLLMRRGGLGRRRARGGLGLRLGGGSGAPTRAERGSGGRGGG